jgi:hypothetical protein
VFLAVLGQVLCSVVRVGIDNAVLFAGKLHVHTQGAVATPVYQTPCVHRRAQARAWAGRQPRAREGGVCVCARIPWSFAPE